MTTTAGLKTDPTPPNCYFGTNILKGSCKCDKHGDYEPIFNAEKVPQCPECIKEIATHG